MSTMNPPRDGAATWGQERTPAAVSPQRAGNWRTHLAILSMVVPALLLLGAGLIAGPPPEDGEIVEGVRVGNYELAATGWNAAAADLETRTEAFLSRPLTLVIGDEQVETTPAELGLSYDLEATLGEAQAVGRGSVFSAARERFEARTSGIEIEPVVTYDSEQFTAAIANLSSDAVHAPQDARFVAGDNGVVVQPSEDGVGIDTSGALARIRDSVSKFQSGTIQVPTVAIEPKLTTEELNALLDEANRLAGQPLILKDGPRSWQMSTQELTSLLRYDESSVWLDTNGLAVRIATLSNAIRQPPVNAQIVRAEDGTFSIADGTIGRSLDVDASVAAVEAQRANDSSPVALVIEENAPAIKRDDVFPVYRELTSIVTRGMTVSWSEGQYTLDSVLFSQSLLWDVQNQEVGFSRDKLAEALSPAVESATRAPSNIRWKNGQLVKTEESSPGTSVDVPATVDNIIERAQSGDSIAELVVVEAEQIDPQTAGIEIRDVLGSASTYYGDSSQNRKVNVETAAAALDGALVAPNSEFSFNQAIGGTATLEDGYMMGYGIMTDESGTPVTVPSVAGGICQVSTTVFQASFWAGMPITNRSWHMYWIPRYGDGPGGMQGLDATVEPDYGLDFNFFNPTNDWLAIRAKADGQWITVDVLGVDQGWTVEASDPVITNVQPASQEIVRQEDPSVSPGSEIWVENAQDGFTATIHRVVKDKNGNIIDDHKFVSSYVPARNVVLVAPGESSASNEDSSGDTADSDSSEESEG